MEAIARELETYAPHKCVAASPRAASDAPSSLGAGDRKGEAVSQHTGREVEDHRQILFQSTATARSTARSLPATGSTGSLLPVTGSTRVFQSELLPNLWVTIPKAFNGGNQRFKLIRSRVSGTYIQGLGFRGLRGFWGFRV